MNLQLDTSLPTGYRVFVTVVPTAAGGGPDFSSENYLGYVLDSELAASPTLVDATALSSSPLAGNTTYWVTLFVLFTPTQAAWIFTDSTSGVGVAGESHYIDGTVYPNSDGLYQMQVTTTAVPEPSSLIMAGTAALAGLGLWSRRRGR